MTERIAIFWPGDYRPKPNELALPNVEQATVQLERALASSGPRALPRRRLPDQAARGDREARPDRRPDRSASSSTGSTARTRPTASSARTTRCCSPATSRGPGPAWSACSTPAPASRAWTGRSRASGPTRRRLDRRRRRSWSGSTSGARRGRIVYGEDELHAAPPTPAAAAALAAKVADGIRQRRVLALMLGDTSMGMINGYFGPRLLDPHRLHRAQGRSGLDHRSRQVASRRSRIDDAFRFVQDKGVTFHWGENGAADFDEKATREQLRDYLAVLDLLDEFKADCLGWQYQLGLLPLRPPSRLRRGPAQLGLPPGVERRHSSSARPRPTRATWCRWR